MWTSTPGNATQHLTLTKSGRPAKYQVGKTVLTRNSRQTVMVMPVYGVHHVGYFSTLLKTRGLRSISPGQKHYSKQTVYDAHLTSKKHLKAVAKQASSGEPAANPNGPATVESSHQTTQSTAKIRLRNSAFYTYLATDLLVSLLPTLNETKSNVERRFSLTAREREQELLEQSKPAPALATVATEGGPEEEEEEERIYNPLKLPLGWDGKPIPYWLYKLHGLGVEYRCEICSDHVYMGRCVFDKFLTSHQRLKFYLCNSGKISIATFRSVSFSDIEVNSS